MEYESILTVRDEGGRLLAIFVNDIKERSINVYGCEKYGLEKIKNLLDKVKTESPREITGAAGE